MSKQPGKPIKLRVVYYDGMVNIDSETEGFDFGLIERMYLTGDGVGCQVTDEADRPKIETLCTAIAAALRAYKGA